MRGLYTNLKISGPKSEDRRLGAALKATTVARHGSKRQSLASFRTPDRQGIVEVAVLRFVNAAAEY